MKEKELSTKDLQAHSELLSRAVELIASQERTARDIRLLEQSRLMLLTARASEGKELTKQAVRLLDELASLQHNEKMVSYPKAMPAHSELLARIRELIVMLDSQNNAIDSLEQSRRMGLTAHATEVKRLTEQNARLREELELLQRNLEKRASRLRQNGSRIIIAAVSYVLGAFATLMVVPHGFYERTLDALSIWLAFSGSVLFIAAAMLALLARPRRKSEFESEILRRYLADRNELARERGEL